MAIALSGSLILSGSITVSGSIISTGTISMSGSIASASYAANADTLDGLDSTVFTLTSSFAAQTASFTAFTSSINSFSASVLTFTGSAATRLGALETYTSSLNNKTSSFATTGSNTFIGTQVVSGSVLQSGSFTSTGTLTAQTLVVQTITSSVVYSSGSNIFGNAIGNTQTFTGSVNITGSLSLNNITIPTSASLASTYLQLAGGTLTGTLGGTSASFSGTMNADSYGIAGAVQAITWTTNTLRLGQGTYWQNIELWANGSSKLTIASTGAATISAPTTDYALTVNGTALWYTARFIGSATTGQSYGPSITAGTNSSDQSFIVQNKAATSNYFVVRGDGNVGIGTSSPLGLLQLFGAEVAAYKTYTGQGNTGGGDAIINAYRLDGASNYLRVTDIVALGDDTNNRGSSIRLMVTNTSGVTSTALTLASTGAATFSGALSGTSATFSMPSGNGALTIANSSLSGKNWTFLPNTNGAESDLLLYYAGASAGTRLTIASTGEATFSSSVNTSGNFVVNNTGGSIKSSDAGAYIAFAGATGSPANSLSFGTLATTRLTIASTGAATFSSSVTSTNLILNGTVTTALDLTSGTFSYGLDLNNNVFLRQKNVAGTLGLMIGISTDNNLYVRGFSGINLQVNNGTTALALTSGGNVGIGTAQTGGAITRQLEVYSAAGAALGDTYARFGIGSSGAYGGNVHLEFAYNDYGNVNVFSIPAKIAALMDPDGSGYGFGNLAFYTKGTAGLVAPTERMRITREGFTKMSNDGTYVSSGGSFHEIKTTLTNNNPVYISNTASSNPYGAYIVFPNASPNDATRYFLSCVDSTTTRFSALSNGGIANYSANDVNLSDERTKKDIISLESYWNKFKAIEIVKFKYKDQTHDDYNIGVIAQQVESIAPEFVDVDGFGETPEDGIPYKTIYTSDLHHTTIKVLQEAMTKIETLEARVQYLENK